MTGPDLLTRAEVAKLARCAPITVYRAWEKYRQSGGASGLRGVQRSGPNGTVLFHPDDVARWTEGERPATRGRKPLRRSA